MTPYELSVLIYEATVTVDSTFQTWLGATFAIVIAAYAVGDRMRWPIKSFLAFLYLATAAFLYFRYTHIISYVVFYYSELARLNAAATNPGVVKEVAVIRQLVIALGTLGALAFLFFPSLTATKALSEEIPKKRL